MKSIWTVSVMALAAFTAQPAPVEHVLDILTYRLTPERSSSRKVLGAEGQVSSSVYASWPASALSVTLSELDRRVYNPGDRLVYEVVIQNMSLEPVTLPWSPDRVRFSEVKGGVEGILTLEVRDVSGRRLLGRLESQALYGSKAVPDSLLKLLPGERARIRAPSVWNSPEHERDLMLAEANGLLRVSVVYLSGSRRLGSKNDLEVSLIPRAANN